MISMFRYLLFYFICLAQVKMQGKQKIVYTGVKMMMMMICICVYNKLSTQTVQTRE